MKKICICLLILSGVLLVSCNRNGAKVGGRFVGNDNQTVYLEMIVPGSQVVVDSTATDDNGFFDMKVKLPDGEPTIYNLVCNGERVPLLLAPGEKVKLHAVGNIYRNYTVEGSEGSRRMKELKDIMTKGGARLDSILKVYSSADQEAKREIASRYTSEYYRTKREHITFIVSDPGSLVALYALYQRLPNDPDLFNGSTDIIYYRLVADSTSKYYPTSPYVKALQKEIAATESGIEMANMIKEKLETGDAEGFPDLNMPDMYGKNYRLSSLKGKVILVDFWSAASSSSAMLNAEMKELYSELAPSGLEIYQISVDRSKSLWVNSVQEQKLPWISVSDLNGESSMSVRAYNVKTVPANFIIDREGNVVHKNVYGDELGKKLKELL